MRKTAILGVALLALTLSCSRKEYDISEGFNKEISVFQEEITVPVGSIGPVTIGSTLDGISQIPGLGGMISQYIKEGENGDLMMESEGNIFKINVYELEKQMKDPAQAEQWNAGFQSGYIGGLAGLVGMFGLKAIHQKLSIRATNPLSADVPVTCSAVYNYTDQEAGTISTPIPQLQSFTMEWTREPVEKVSLSIPESIPEAVSGINLNDLTLSIPAHPAEKISDKQGNLFFSMDYKYSAGVSVGANFNVPMSDLAIRKISLPIGQFKAKYAEVRLEVENTIPLSVNVGNVRVLEPKESDEEPDVINPDIEIDADIILAGGSIDQPATSKLTLSIEAKEGTIPDINALMLDLELNPVPSLANVPLSAKQGLFIRSAVACVRGGVTIPIHLFTEEEL